MRNPTNTNNSFINNSGTNLSLFLTSGGLNSIYANNTAIGCDWAIIFGGWGNNVNATPVRNSTISGNTVINFNSGSEAFVVNGTGNNITGNLVEGTGEDSGTFVLDGSWNLMAGNTVTNNYENASLHPGRQ